MDTFIYDADYKRDLRERAHPFGEVSFLEALAQPGMTALDIGANKGLTTVAIAKAIAPQGRVYAFEPVPDYYRTLQANLARNQVRNAKAFCAALGHTIGRIDYYKDGGASGIVAHDQSDKISVESTTLDDFVEDEGLGRVDLISMDCEGSELLVFQGGERTLTSCPLSLFCEIHREALKALGQSLRDVVSWLERRVFQVKPVFVDDLDNNVGYERCTHILASRQGPARDSGGPAQA